VCVSGQSGWVECTPPNLTPLNHGCQVRIEKYLTDVWVLEGAPYRLRRST